MISKRRPSVACSSGTAAEGHDDGRRPTSTNWSARLPWNITDCYHRRNRERWQSAWLYVTQGREIGIVTANYAHSNEDWKNVRLSNINLSVRTSNCLYHMGLTTLGELASLSEAELLRQPNFGRKSLNEVKALLSSTEGLTLREECTDKEDELDFLTIEESISSILLRPVQTLDLTTRASNVMENQGITTVGELVQLTESELLRTPNAGRLTINNLKSVLAQLGLSLGTTVQNWPSKEELALLLEARARDRLDRTQTPIGRFAFLEDELCAIVKAAVGTSERAIVTRRTGWDGDRVWTLEELANDPTASGRTSRVSRERIRQIESKAIEKIQKKGMSTPILYRAIALIEENAPLANVNIPDLLRRHGITQTALGYEALSAAMNTFQVDWDLVYTVIGQDAFLLPSDQVGEIECSWSILVEAAVDQDFVELDRIANVDRYADPLSLEVAVSGVSEIPSLGWLNRDRRIYWSPDRVRRGWNKPINVCRKILTVAPEVPLKRLTAAVKRARTVRDFPPDDTFMNMLLASDEFEVDDGMVSRGESFKPGMLSNTDQVMIRAAMDAGTVTTFTELREVLVRQGLSANYAQVLMVVSPFWVTVERGKYRFIGKQSQLDESWLKEPAEVDEIEGCQERLVGLEVNYRHLVIGNHRIDEELVRPGQWSLRDEKGNDLGKIDVTSRMIRGLNRSFLTAGVEVGTYVIIDFSESEEEFSAMMFY